MNVQRRIVMEEGITSTIPSDCKVLTLLSKLVS